MSDQSLKDLEKKAYLSYHDDGLLECFIGLFILVFGIGMQFDTVGYLGGTVPALGIPLYAALKKKLILPRIGLVQFGPERKFRMKKEHVFYVVFFAMTALMGVVVFIGFERVTGDVEMFVKRFVMLPMGVIGMIAFSAVAYWKQIPRYGLHAGLMLLFVIIGPLLNVAHPHYFMTLGVLILGIGIVVTVRFFRKYPKTTEEALHGEL